MILKQFFLALLLVLGLLGCQSVPNADARNTVAIDKTLVHSFHLGANANAQPYLLIVLNDKGIQTFEATAKKVSRITSCLMGMSINKVRK